MLKILNINLTSFPLLPPSGFQKFQVGFELAVAHYWSPTKVLQNRLSLEAHRPPPCLGSYSRHHHLRMNNWSYQKKTMRKTTSRHPLPHLGRKFLPLHQRCIDEVASSSRCQLFKRELLNEDCKRLKSGEGR